MKRYCDKRIFSTLTVMVLFLILTFVFLLNSPLHPWIDGEATTDSSVFKTMAMMMEKGYMPYKDSFDHKGPYIYILNWLGNRISSYRGVWVIEFITIFLSMVALYKTARLCCNKVFSCITVFVSLSLLFGYFQGGNLAEEYAVPLIAISQFIFLDYLINDRVSKFRLMLCGFCFGAICLLRINMGSVWVAFGATIFILCFVRKQYSRLKEFTIFFLLGVCLIAIPIFVWLGANGALADFWENYIVFNREYISASGGRAYFSKKWQSFFFFLNNTITIFAIIISIYFCIFKNKILYGAYLCYIFLSLLFTCLSGMTYSHYGMALIPMVSFPIASLLDMVSPQKQEKGMALIVIVYLMGVIVMPDWLDLCSEIMLTHDHKEETHRDMTTYEISEYIKNNTSENDTISVYGNWNIIYVLSDRAHATKYSYQFPLCEVMPSIRNEYLEQLGEELPPIIVVQSRFYDDTISTFLEEKGYALVLPEKDHSLDGAMVFEMIY